MRLKIGRAAAAPGATRVTRTAVRHDQSSRLYRHPAGNGEMVMAAIGRKGNTFTRRRHCEKRDEL